MEPRKDGAVHRGSTWGASAPLFTVGVTLTLAFSPAYGGDWTVETSISLGSTLTNNVNLAPPPQAQSDVILTAVPVVRVQGEGGRLRGSLSYAPSLNTYLNNTNSGNIQNNLIAQANLEAVKNFFFVDFRASAFQTLTNPFGPAPTVGSNTNRTQSYTVGISPYIQGVTQNEITYLARYDALWNNYSGQNSDLYQSTVTTRLTGPRNRRVTWTAEYLRYDYDFANSIQGVTSSDIGRLILDYEVVPTFSLQARGGYESNNFTGIDGYNGGVYGGGLSWRPSARTSVNSFAERRYFGTGYNFDASHRTRLTAWRLYASQDTTTSPQLQQLTAGGTNGPADLLDAALTARFPDPAQRQAQVAQTLNQLGFAAIPQSSTNFANSQLFKQERIGGSAALIGKRNRIVFNLFWNKNTPLTAPGQPLQLFGFNRPFDQKGGALTYSLTLSAISSVNASFSRTRTTQDPTFAFPVGQSSSQDVFRLVYSRELAPRTTGFIGARYQTFGNSDQIAGDAKEQAMFVGLTHRWY
jgi:uncharacterized protein (PEP-CTERM system associated)